MNKPALPARVQAALDYLEHCRWKTERSDPALPGQTLSTLEQRVATAALRVLDAYFLGEMDYGDAPPRRARDGDDDDGPAQLVAAPGR